MKFFAKIFSAASKIDKTDRTNTLDARKVLLILPWLPVGGVETLFVGLVKRCPNYHFDVATTREIMTNMGDRTESFEKIGCTVNHLERQFSTDEERKVALFNLIEDGQYANVFLVGSTLAYDLLPELKTKLPALNVIDQQFNDGKHLNSTRILHQYINATIVPSPVLAEKLQDLDRIFVIPHGIEIPSESVLTADREEGLTLLSAEHAGKFIVSFIGRLAPEKDPHLFVRVVAKLKDLPDIAFCMVGDGPDRDSVLQLIDDLGLKETIKYFGFIDRIDPLVAVSDVVVVPSVSDGQPLVVLHSQLHGKAVVASSVGSIPLMIEDNYSGCLLEAKDTDGFARKISDLYANRKSLEQLSQNAFKSVREKFDESGMVERYKRLLTPLS